MYLDVEPGNYNPETGECLHPTITRPRARTIANGSVQYRRQCLQCGEAIGNPVAARIALQETRGNPLAFDETLFTEGRERGRENERRRHEAERDEWFAWYNEYLESSEWADRRRRVLERCGGLCEGCREATATVVHHRTYDDVGQELLYQLVGLCAACHDRAHSSNGNQIPAAVWILEATHQ